MSLLVACGGGSSGPTDAGPPDGRSTLLPAKPICSRKCRPAVSVLGQRELLDYFMTTALWVPYLDSECHFISDDLMILNLPISLDQSDLAELALGTCSDPAACSTAQVLFSTFAPSGCLEAPENSVDCSSVRFEGQVRFSIQVQDPRTIPEGSTFDTSVHVRLLPGCDQDCAGDDIVCDANKTCWPSSFNVGDSYCENCLGLPPWECDCLTSKGIEPDGTECSYTSLDMLNTGICEEGTCN